MTQPLKVLKRFWGYDGFRSMQEEIIQSVLEGKDTLALLPTGGGKSICFQVPALCQKGICIVISPLIALMKDQVQNLKKRGIPAVAIYSGMHYKEIDRTFDNCIYGKVKFLYISPERLVTDIARERIKKMNVNLLAIDEAHCISQWGYDFRPPYLEIANFREHLPNVPIIALTATATTDVVQDIQAKLAFRAENVFQKSFARNNLVYVVLKEEDKRHKLLDILRKVRGSAVIYARNRKKTKRVAQFLWKNRISADFYHAGLTNEVRSQKQDAWIQNRTRVIVATNAFGMGIDKPDVRVVIHLDLPDSLEAYFQEAGRAGRDGKPAYAVMLYSDLDVQQLQHQQEQTFPEMAYLRRVYDALGNYFQLAIGSGKGESFDFDLITFGQRYNFDFIQVYNALKILMKEGWIVLTESIFMPSTLQVLATKDQLYDFKLRNRGFEKLISTILRTYHGAFNDFVRINEKQLAKFLKISPARIHRGLNLLKQEGIIEYRPYKENPQIIYTHERLSANNLTIDQATYNFLKDRQAVRVKAMVNYVTEQRCNSQLLLEYFGEKEPPTCGKCDICTNRHSDTVTDEEFQRYQAKIKQILTQQPQAPKRLANQFPAHRHPKLFKVLQHLMDNQFIEEKNGLLYWK